jgi:periplasmic divalent cation tolerance protein
MTALIVFCTCPDRESAQRLARALVEQRLAACIGVVPGVRSIYRWNDAVEEADEAQLLIKTTSERYPALEAAVRAAHPYELPELIAVEAAAGSVPYLDWIGASTLPAADDPRA